jgi:putative phosphoribosyl transferase
MFASREEAGRLLGEHLRARSVQADIVLGLPRGGVVVAAEVAKILRVPLDVLIVRKIGHPLHREFAVGALAESEVMLLEDAPPGSKRRIRVDLSEIIEEERQRLKAYQARFHPDGVAKLADKIVLVVDDGLATGATARAAVISARKQFALKVFVAAPVASVHAIEQLGTEADQVYALCVDPNFEAVGHYYAVFSQTTDEEVLGLLRAASIGAYCRSFSTLWGN